MSLANLTGTTVRHASVRGAQFDSIAAQRSTERLLEQIPSIVPGMSASAVLCVRELSVHVRSKPRYMQSDGSILGEEMERLARHAARPVHGPVSPQAAAVLFTDRAELLCCLARDYVRNLLVQGWWWRVLLPEADIVRAAVRLWVNEAAHAPAALARLARTGDAVAFVRALGEAEVGALVQSMVRTHGLALLAGDATVASIQQSRTQSESPALSKFHHNDGHESPRTMEKEVRAALPEAWIPGLSGMQRRLLAVGLSLVRLPGLVRNSSYAHVLSVLMKQANETARSKHRSVQSCPVEIYSPVESPGVNELRSSSGISTSSMRVDPVEANPSFEKSGTNGIHSSTGVTHNSVHVEPVETQSTLSEVKELGLNRIYSPSDPIRMGSTSMQPAMPVALLEGSTRIVQTQYGGVFFLCNAALALGLYPDFTRPLDRGLELSLWDFLALAAVDLGGPAVRQDPLWPLLAEFAGRAPGQRPGAGFAPPGEWRLPVKWLLPFTNNAVNWTWEADAVRLVVRHPAGFVVLDLPRNDMAVEDQLRVELAQYAFPGINQTIRSRRAPIAPLARWRGWLMPYLGRRVAQALGDKHWRHSCRRMMCLPARIECDTERLDVYFSLEQLPVMVRMAGLDRDPGWIPAAGRDLRFHFGCDHA